jgi:hypothetical protein
VNNKLRRLISSIKRWVSDVGQSSIDDSLLINEADPVIRRLQREYEEKNPDIRRVRANNLVDEIISLMFGLSSPPGYSFHKLTEQLQGSRRLHLQRIAFYVYVDRTNPLAGQEVSELSENFYSRLTDLAKVHQPVLNLIRDFYEFKEKIAKPNTEIEPFNAESNDHQKKIKLFFPCYFSICPKDFPKELRSYTYVAGRLLIHDRNAIQRWEQKEQEKKEQQDKLEPSETLQQRAWLATTIKSDGIHDDKRVRLNAHRFVDTDASAPQPETQLYIGNWRTNWDFLVGAAEHDEIQCAELGERSGTIRLSKLQLQQEARWSADPKFPDNLPEWLKCSALDFEEVPDNVIKIYVTPYAGLFKPLLPFITRKEFPQELKLIARVMPTHRGQLDDFLEMGRDFLQVIANLRITISSAINIQHDSLWLVSSADGSIFRLFKQDGLWSAKAVNDGDSFAVGNVSYLWNAATGMGYPMWVRGLLHIRPPDNQRQNFICVLNKQPGAELAIVYDERTLFPLNPDTTLGRAGIVKLRCTELKHDGTAIYGLVPVRDSRIPFFDFQKDVYSNIWYSYEGESSDTHDVNRERPRTNDNIRSLRFDRQRGQVVYDDGQPVLTKRGSYHLICGTSFFQIKVSGTPDVEGRSTAERDQAISTEQEVLALPRAEFDPTDSSDVMLRLSDTVRWKECKVNYFDKSNFAAHYTVNVASKEYFLKAYFGDASAEREAGFYERYDAIGDDINIQVPEEILRVTTGNSPWAIIFPRLRPLEEWLPPTNSLSLAQSAAIGLGYARLLKRLAEDHLINYDIDPSTICLSDTGQLLIVDFDNTFPLFMSAADVPPLRSIIDSGRLPAKNRFLPPEAYKLREASDNYEREKALREIGSGFGTYMLAVILLQLLKMVEVEEGDPRYIRIAAGVLIDRAKAERSNIETASELEHLLGRMIDRDQSRRPPPAEVLSKFVSLTESFRASSELAAKQVSELLG